MTYAVPGSTRPVSGAFTEALKPLVGQHLDVRFATFASQESLHSHTLIVQRNGTKLELAEVVDDAFPVARTPKDIVFASLAEHLDDSTQSSRREKAIWSLCSLLFDPLDVAAPQFLEGVPQDQVENFAEKMRMDALGLFWAKEIVGEDVQKGLKRAKTPEEKAIVLLTGNDVAAACEVLVQAREFKLAALVARLPGSEQGRAAMSKQIQAWTARNDWSEISEPVRALYSILAGQTCKVQGKPGAAEDRARQFNISEQFELTWEQSFALRLYHGGHQNITEAIDAFQQDLDSCAQAFQPIKSWPDGTETPDTLMELLRWYAGLKDAAALLDPLAVSGDSLNSRLSWQLASIFASSNTGDVPHSLLDKLTYDLATELESAGQLLPSVWTLLHLSDRTSSEHALIELLDRNANQISDPREADDLPRGTFEFLTEDTLVPAPFVWRAKALFAGAILNDPALQASWLLHAGDVDEAHEIVCLTVVPRAVIEQDYERLEVLLEQFKHFAAAEDWARGGAVYAEFLHLINLLSREGSHGRAVAGCARKVQRGLVGMERDVGRKKSLEERVAELEMARVVGEALRELGEGQDGDAVMDGLEGERSDVGGLGMLKAYQTAMGIAG